MNSINELQEEINHKDLYGVEAIQKIKELADKANTCFFCSAITSGKAFKTRPMSVQKTDDMGNLWFVSSDDSHLNAEIQNDRHVQLLFRGSAHSDFLNLYGSAVISRDKNKIKELWEPIMKTWFTDGEDDPRITVIKVTPEEGYYWDTKHGNPVAFIKMAIGAIAGKTMDDSIEGKISVAS